MTKVYTLTEIQAMSYAEAQEALVRMDSELSQLRKECEALKTICKKQGWKVNDTKS